MLETDGGPNQFFYSDVIPQIEIYIKHFKELCKTASGKDIKVKNPAFPRKNIKLGDLFENIYEAFKPGLQTSLKLDDGVYPESIGSRREPTLTGVDLSS